MSKNRKNKKSEATQVEGTTTATVATEPEARKPRRVVIDGEKVVDVATSETKVEEPTVETTEPVVVSEDKPVEEVEVVSGPQIVWDLEPTYSDPTKDGTANHLWSWLTSDKAWSVTRCVSKHPGGEAHFKRIKMHTGVNLGLTNSLRNAITLVENEIRKTKGMESATSNKEEVIAQAALKELDTLPAKPGRVSSPAVVPLNEEQKKELDEKVKKVLELCETLGLPVEQFIASQQKTAAKTPATSKQGSNGTSTPQVGRAKVLIFGKYSSVGIVQWMRSHKWSVEDCLKVLPLVGSPISASTVKSMLKDKGNVAEKKPGPELSDEEEQKLEEMRK